MWTRFVLPVIAIGAALVLSPPRASASQFTTVGTILEDCGSDRTSPAWGLCVGYLGAIADRMASAGIQQAASGTKAAPNEAICLDGDNDDFSVIVPLFVTWAQRHPEKQNLPAFLGVAFALQEKWPCR